MRLYNVILVIAATLLANTNAFSTIDSNQESRLTSTHDVHPIDQVHADTNTKRNLRVDTATDEERAIKIPIVDDVTEYLNQLTLKYWLKRKKDPTEVWDLLKLNGLKGKAFKKPKHRYYREYVAMWNADKAAKAAKNAATTV